MKLWWDGFNPSEDMWRCFYVAFKSDYYTEDEDDGVWEQYWAIQNRLA